MTRLTVSMTPRNKKLEKKSDKIAGTAIFNQR